MIYKITRDSGANVKKLKTLEQQGYIEIYDVKLENGRENKKVKEKILPVLVLDHARLGECVLGGEDTVYDDIRKIIGKNNIEDAMHLEAHIRNKHDYFVTEDTDFLKVKNELQEKFSIKIVTPDDLMSIFMNKYAE
jgi:predicted nucleic acid-binding protein